MIKIMFMTTHISLPLNKNKQTFILRCAGRPLMGAVIFTSHDEPDHNRIECV